VVLEVLVEALVAIMVLTAHRVPQLLVRAMQVATQTQTALVHNLAGAVAVAQEQQVAPHQVPRQVALVVTERHHQFLGHL